MKQIFIAIILIAWECACLAPEDPTSTSDEQHFIDRLIAETRQTENDPEGSHPDPRGEFRAIARDLLSYLRTQEAQLIQQLKELEKIKERCTTEMQRLHALMISKQAEIDKYKLEISGLSSSSNTKGQKKLQARINVLQDEINVLQDEIQDLLKTLHAVIEELQEVKTDIDNSNNQLHDIRRLIETQKQNIHAYSEPDAKTSRARAAKVSTTMLNPETYRDSAIGETVRSVRNAISNQSINH